MGDRAPEAWRLSRAVLRLIVILIVGAALAFAAAPFFAFRAMKAAARDGDGQALAELVDYGSVRAGLRTEVAAQPVAAPPPPDLWTDPLGVIRRAIEPIAPTPPRVEPYLDAKGLYDLARGYSPGKAPADAGQGGSARLRYWAPNRARFSVSPRGATGEPAVVFSFQRQDLFTWKLVHIRPPPPPV